MITLGLVLPVQAADHEEATRAAFAVGLGRAATTAEMHHAGPFGSTLEQLRKRLSTAPEQQREVATRAVNFVFGSSNESTAVEARLFADAVGEHLANLSQNPSTYQQVLQRAYQHVIGRDVYAEELEYWSKHPTLPYALLVGCIEDWARRNQPGLMNTAGTPTISINCELLATTRTSPELGAEIAKRLRLPEDTPVLNPGGTGIKSSGDIRFVVIEAL